MIGIHRTLLIIPNYEISNEAKSGGAEGLSCFFGLRERGTLRTDGVESLDGLLSGHLCSLLHRLQ